MRPTLRGILLAASGAPLALAAAFAPGVWWYWLALTSLSLAALAADVLLAPRLGAATVALTLPPRLHVGEPATGTLTVHPGGRQDWSRRLGRLRLHVDASESLHLRAPRYAERPATRRGTVEVPLALHPTRRGVGEIPAVWLRAAGPLGLMERQRTAPLGVAVEVAPNLPGAARDVLSVPSLGVADEGIRVERFRGDGTEFESLRPYTPGDDLRALDWKASARLAAPLVRETRAERNRDVLLAVDAGRLMGEPLAGVPRLDHAVRASLALATVAVQVGDRVGFAAFDARLRHFAPPTAGIQAVTQLAQTAARVAYSTEETNFTLALTELAARQRRRALVVVMTDFVDAVSAELLVENLAQTSQDHVVLFVALRDPALDRLADAPPETLLDLHRAVVAGELLQDRATVLARLSQLGIACLDTTPTALSVDLIERYLVAKRKELF